MNIEELEYINVIIANSSASFCHYDNKLNPEDQNQFIAIELLRDLVKFSSKHDLYLNILCGEKSIPHELNQEISKADHLKLIPLSNYNNTEESIVIVDEQDYNKESLLPDEPCETIILRINRKNLGNLANLANRYSEKCNKLNIVLAELEDLSSSDISLFKDQVSNLAGMISEKLKRGRSCEINCLTDRIVLKEMNNCNAGIKHVTFAPDGNFYLCPGFYYDNNFSAIGNIQDGIKINNPELLTVEKSPICRICDAYQCKRCIYLNKKMTAEINVPSYEQCVCSHIERDGSRKVISELKYSNSKFHNIVDIVQLPYIDPFDKLKDNKNIGFKRKETSINDLPPLEPLKFPHTGNKKTSAPKKKDSKPLNDKEILEKIHNTQLEILKMLKYLRGI